MWTVAARHTNVWKFRVLRHLRIRSFWKFIWFVFIIARQGSMGQACVCTQGAEGVMMSLPVSWQHLPRDSTSPPMDSNSHPYYGGKAGSMHPPGMLSCLISYLVFYPIQRICSFSNWSIWSKVPIRPVDSNCNEI